METMLKKHLADAQDLPALKDTLKDTIAAVHQQKRDALSLSDKRAHFCAHIRSLSAKMDQQTKILEEATATVYLRLEKLPSDSLPVPKTAVVPSYSGQGEPAPFAVPGQPAPTPEVLLTLMAFAQHKARNGDQEAQKVYDQLTDAPDVLRLISNASNGAAPVVPTPAGEQPMEDDKEVQQNQDPQPGEPDADEVMAEDRKRIRNLLEQVEETPGTVGDASSASSSGAVETTLRPKKAKTQPDSQG
eukprot:5100295-Amphidinium_carterae.1